MNFESFAARAFDTTAARGSTYADIRFEVGRAERIEVRNGIVASLTDSASNGYGIRAFVDGAWGFAAGSDFSNAGVDRIAAQATAIAKASVAVARHQLGRASAKAYVDTFATPVLRDPTTVPLGERVALLLEAEKRLHSGEQIAVGRAWLDIWGADKYFFSSIGSKIEQRILQTGCGIQALSVGEGDAQTRTFPGDIGLYKTGGWEIVEEAKLLENAQRIGEESYALLSAPQCPNGTYDIVLGGSQVSLQIHESCGHPAELDRVFGWEANFSGTSFLETAQLGKLQYGSDLVTIVIDNTLPAGMATCGYDDEGTKSGTSDIIRNGVLSGYEMSNDTAHLIGRESNGCVRAQSWEHVPIIRMCNLNLLPGNTPFENLFDDVREGMYMESNRSWSIDDRRLNFQFGCEIAWEIKNGKRGRMLKNPTYAGMTPAFWNSCDAIADKTSWNEWGTPNCGKGEPMQSGRTTQACAPARFRNVSVAVVTVHNTEREALARRVLEFSEADQTEVLLHADDNALTRFTHESVNQNIGTTNVALSVRAIVDNRTGVARTNRQDEASLRDVIVRAITMAKLAPRDDAQPLLPQVTEAVHAPDGAWIEATAQRDPQQRAEQCDRAFRVAEANEFWSAGYCATSSAGITIANSRGTLTSFNGTDAVLNVKFTAADSTGYGECYTSDIAKLDAHAVAETAARKARETANPTSVDPGEWTVILEPAAFGELLTYLFSHFGAQQYDEGSSFFSGTRETADGFHLDPLSERFTLLDDYAHPLYPSMPFDYEGHPTARMALVENGRVRNIVTDSYWANKLNRPNTGHALPAPNANGPHVRNAVVGGGEKSVAQLISETKRGLLVSRFWYIRTVDSKQAIVTGMTRDGTYLIENGKLAGGVRNLRFNQSILDALRRCEFAIEQKRTGGYAYSLVVPAIKIDGFRFTSTTEF